MEYWIIPTADQLLHYKISKQVSEQVKLNIASIRLKQQQLDTDIYVRSSSSEAEVLDPGATDHTAIIRKTPHILIIYWDVNSIKINNSIKLD